MKRCLSSLLLLALAISLLGAAPQPPVITPENAARLQVVFTHEFGPWNLVTAIAWQPGGRRLAVAVANSLVIFDADFKLLQEIPLGSLTHGLAFHPGGSLLASAGRDGYVRLWDVSQLPAAPAKLLWQVQAHRKGANTVVFRPDGAQLASGGSDGLARFWRTDDGAKLDYIIGGAFATPALAFLPDQRLAMVNGKMVRLREAETERILGAFQSDANLYSLALDPSGAWLAVGGMDNRVRLWRVEQAFKTGAQTYPAPVLLEGHAGSLGTFRSLIWQVNFSPDGRLLVSAGGDGSIRLWSVSLATGLAAFPAHHLAATCAVFSPDGRFLAAGGLDGRLQVWAVP